MYFVSPERRKRESLPTMNVDVTQSASCAHQSGGNEFARTGGGGVLGGGELDFNSDQVVDALHAGNTLEVS